MAREHSAPVPRWQQDKTIVLRYFGRGRRSALFQRAPSRLATALSSGSPVGRPPSCLASRVAPSATFRSKSATGSPWDVIDRPWTGDGALILGRSDRAHSISLFWENWRFAGWYVQLEAPWRPWRFGFDTESHALDVWVESDGSWHWKEECELDLAVELGFFSSEQAAAVRAEGERVVGEWPLPTGWEEWRANPSWPVPSVPATGTCEPRPLLARAEPLELPHAPD
jgi:hypothetical protein